MHKGKDCCRESKNANLAVTFNMQKPKQRQLMGANTKTLQGNLFNDEDQDYIDSQAQEKVSKAEIDDLSETNLVADAEKRPRKPKKSTSGDPEKPNFNDAAKNPNADLPAWSHHSMVKVERLTPMLQHYVAIKTEQPERILLYRLGDFFECFFEDAILLSQILELTLTGKEGGKSVGRVPMAGIPHHAAERYCIELIKRGYSIALCDQLETTPAKGALLKRGVTRILTPGTIIETGMLSARKNNWLSAILIEEDQESFNWGLATADVSTG